MAIVHRDGMAGDKVEKFLKALSKHCICNEDEAYKIAGKLGVNHTVTKKVTFQRDIEIQ